MKTKLRPNAADCQVARRLRIARIAAGISQADAANHVGVTQQQILKYENGTNRVSAGCLALLAQFYRRPVAWFFEGVALDSKDILDITRGPIARARLAAKVHDSIRPSGSPRRLRTII